MANTLLDPKVYANTMLALLKNNLVMGKMVTTEFKNEFKKIGNTVYVKRPPEFVVREGAVAQTQEVIEGETPVVMDRQRGIDIEFSSLEDTLQVDDLLKNAVMQAQAAQLAQTIDSDLMSQCLEFPSWVGTPGQDINAATDFFRGPERLDLMAVPQDKRCGVLSPLDYWALAGGFTNLPVQEKIGIDALERARLPLVGNVQPYMTQSVINLTTGSRAATGASVVNGAGQNVSYTSVSANDYKQTLNIDGLTAGHTIKAGEVFSADGVFFVNPRTKQSTGQLAQFVVLEDATANGAGEAALTIANPIITSGAYQTVTAAPADGAPITWLGTADTAYRQNAVFHKSAITLVFAKLTDPFTGQASYATDPQTGVTIRYWRTSDGVNDTHLHRWDVLYGVKNVDRRLGTRLSGTA
jgi:hypothetical protein